MHSAAQNGETETCQALKAMGADVNARRAVCGVWCVVNNHGRTPMHSAAQNGETETCQALKEMGADVNATNTRGSTPILCAAREGHTETCLALAQLGAAIGEANDDGQTPADVAEISEFDDLADLLRGGVMSLDAVGPSGVEMKVWADGTGREQAMAALQVQWQDHIDEWHKHAESVREICKGVQGANTRALMQMLQYMLPSELYQQGERGVDSYHLSCLCERRVPELRLAGRASNLPLPLRAARISSTCHAASLDSPQALKSVLRQVLPVAVEVEWLYRYCVFLAKQHGMVAVLGVQLLRLSGPQSSLQHTTQQQSRMQSWHTKSQACKERRQQEQQQQRPPLPLVQRHASAGVSAGAGAGGPAPMPVAAGRVLSAPPSFALDEREEDYARWSAQPWR